MRIIQVLFSTKNEDLTPIIVAHRGASNAYRENTLEAFEAAIEAGADAIEFDVRRTKDGVFVVHHDSAIPSCKMSIARQSYRDAATAAESAGFHLPTLQEALDLCRGRIALDIELKESGYERDIVPFTRDRFPVTDLVITSFYDESLEEVKTLWPEVRTGLILGVDAPASIGLRFSELYPIRRLRRCRADFVAPHYSLLRFGFLQRMKKAGYPVWVWTVNERGRISSLGSIGVAAIITDDPETAR